MERVVTFAVLGDSAASGVGDSDDQGNYFGGPTILQKPFKNRWSI